MPEHYVAVIPSDPAARLPDTAEALRAALHQVAKSGASRVKDYGKCQFIDCGDTPCRIRCPHCDAEVSQIVWQGWMVEDWHADDGFRFRSHVAPCCTSAVTLDCLAYAPAQGFAFWMVSAQSRNDRVLTDSEVADLETVAGVRLTAISQTYDG